VPQVLPMPRVLHGAAPRGLPNLQHLHPVEPVRYLFAISTSCSTSVCSSGQINVRSRMPPPLK